MQFGKVLSKLIAKNGITQAELSRLSGVSRKTIGNFVTGVAKQPTLSHAKALADALGVSLDELAEMCYGGGDD